MARSLKALDTHRQILDRLDARISDAEYRAALAGIDLAAWERALEDTPSLMLAAEVELLRQSQTEREQILGAERVKHTALKAEWDTAHSETIARIRAHFDRWGSWETDWRESTGEQRARLIKHFEEFEKEGRRSGLGA